jgi:tetrahydromethanopterin S-methyltransferase subunit B
MIRGFSEESTFVEIQPVQNRIKDLQGRIEALRGYL